MRLARITIFTTIISAAISLPLSALFKFGSMSAWQHSDYFVNILIGVFASSFLVALTSAVEYKRLKKHYYWKINTTFESIELCMKYSISSKDTLQSCKNHFTRTNKEYDIMIDCINDFHTLLWFGRKHDQIKRIDRFMFKNEFYQFWSDFETAINEDEYCNAFIKANNKYKGIESEYKEIKKVWEEHRDNFLKNPFRKDIG